MDSFSSLMVDIEHYLRMMELPVIGRDISVGAACWLVEISPTTAYTITALSKGDDSVCFVIQSCFGKTTGPLNTLRGPRRVYMGTLDKAIDWVVLTLRPFVELLNINSVANQFMEGELRRFQLGTFINHTKVDTPHPGIKNSYTLRILVGFMVVDVEFDVVVADDQLELNMIVNRTETHSLYSGLEVGVFAEAVVKSLQAIEGRFFVDPEVYDEIRLMPGLWGHNVVAFGQNQYESA